MTPKRLALSRALVAVHHCSLRLEAYAQGESSAMSRAQATSYSGALDPGSDFEDIAVGDEVRSGLGSARRFSAVWHRSHVRRPLAGRFNNSKPSYHLVPRALRSVTPTSAKAGRLTPSVGGFSSHVTGGYD